MRRLIFMTAVAGLVWSCKKEDEPSPEQPLEIETPTSQNEKSYFPMAIGNYWVYEQGVVSSDGFQSELGAVDSTVITRDTLIDGKKYFVFNTGYTYEHLQKLRREDLFLRDSSGYVISPDGTIHFCSTKLGDTLSVEKDVYERDFAVYKGDTLLKKGDIYRAMFSMTNSEKELVNTDLGKFESLVFVKFGWIIIPEGKVEGTAYKRYFTPGIGEVLLSYKGDSATSWTEKRLVRYHVN